MKQLLYTLLLFTSIAFSQSNGFTYQAVIYNPNGEELPGVDNPYAVLVNEDVCLQFGIVDANGALEYQEQVQVTTDDFGMVNLLIGIHPQTGGYANNFVDVVWSAAAKFLKVDLDVKGTCNNFEELSNQPLPMFPLPIILLPLKFLVQKDLRGLKEKLELKDHKDHRVILVQLEQLVHREILDFKEKLVQKDLREILDLREFKDHKEIMVQQEQLVLREILDLLGRMDKTEILALKEKLEPKAHKVLKEFKDHKVILVQLGHKETLGLLDQMDKTELLGLKEKLELKAHKGHKG